MPDPLTSDSAVSSLIAEFLRSTKPPREVHAALSHVDAELGTLPVRAVRTRHVAALLDDLRRAGLSSGRETAIVDALDSLHAFATARGLVAPPVAAERRSPVPTLTMLALGARVAFWTATTIMAGFLVLLTALVVELA